MRHHPPLLALICIASLALLSAAAPAQTPATSPSDARAIALPDDYFPILPWELPPKSVELFNDSKHGLASLAECGFNTAAFVRPEHLAECQKLGLKAIVSDPERTKWRHLSDQQ